MTTAVRAGPSTMSHRTAWWWARLAAAAATFAVLVWRLGTGPFLDGLRTVDGGALAAAAGLAVLTTVCCAWRWRIVARGLGVDLPLGTAVAAYYRSLFLNVTLPGGVVGDVHRGISHGRDTSDVGRGLRAVAWERSAGQVVQVVLTVAVLLVAPSPVRAAMPFVALALLVAAAGVALAARVRPAVRRSRWARVRSAAARDLRDGLLPRRAWPAIALASALVVAGHTVTFLIAARTAGVTAPLSRMLPLVLLVMLAAALPNVGGWGPREGVTAWAFAAAGLGASRGVATAVVYGVMVLVASLPGAAVLVAAWVRRTGRRVRQRPLAAARPLARRQERRMSDRPYTLLSCSVSLDGYLGDRAPRLALSNEADFDRVDEVRASCDAIMVGAVTVRTDNPRLLVRSPARRDRRAARGLAPSPMKITVTNRVDLDARSNFFTTGEAEKLVYTPSPRVADARARLGPLATIVDGGRRVRMRRLSEDLADRGVERLMVEGGGVVHTQFLADDLVDELQLVVAPFFIGDSSAPRFVTDGRFPWHAGRRATLAEVRQIGDVVLLRYALSPRFRED